MSQTVVFFGINIALLNISELTKEIKLSVELKKQLTISYINFNTVNLLKHNKNNVALLNEFDLIFPDGIAISYALHLFEKINETNNKRKYVEVELCLPSLYDIAEKQKWGIYLFGGKKNAGAVESVEKIKYGFSDLKIVGSHHGFLSTNDELKYVIDDINQSGATILFVGMGHPKQDKWIQENKKKINASIIIAVGGYFDKVSQTINAYPGWVFKYKMFWLYRLIQEPKRLWKRYSIGLAMFGWHVLLEKLRK